MDILHEFHEAAYDPYGYAHALKDQGKKIVGYFCSYTPEEIIYAAGLHPMRLFGSKTDIHMAERHLQSYSCSLVRGAMADVLAGRLSFLDGTVFPHTCDSIQRLSDIWRLNTNLGFFADVVLPVKLNTQSARDYMVDVLNRFVHDIEKYFALKISDERLLGAIETYNTIRSNLLSIYELKAKNPSSIKGEDLYAIVRASMVMDRDELCVRLPEVLKGLHQKASAEKAVGKRLMLVGNICDHPDIYSIIEKSGGDVVWDDLCTGTRYFDGMIEVKDMQDPISAIAERYFTRQVCPAKHSSPTARGEHVVKQARLHDVDGVVFLQLKFCDPHSFDYPYIKEFLDGAGIPNMILESEDQLPPEGQLLTRFETFVHML
ncbi:MAG TPA: 2-hydroxyacyl-CoA dehydratase [Deltaproteobacteria bacterium]|nr:2-hydroxyacyl-CoA dehydratase [Deltaproteobacteria bacterium]